MTMPPNPHDKSCDKGASSEQDDDDLFFLPIPSTALELSMQRLAQLVDRHNKANADSDAVTATLAAEFAGDDSVDGSTFELDHATLLARNHMLSSTHTSFEGHRDPGPSSDRDMAAPAAPFVVQAVNLASSPAKNPALAYASLPGAGLTPSLPVPAPVQLPAVAKLRSIAQAGSSQASSQDGVSPREAVRKSRSLVLSEGQERVDSVAQHAATSSTAGAATEQVPSTIPPSNTASAEPPSQAHGMTTDAFLQDVQQQRTAIVIPGTSTVADDLLSADGAHVFEKLSEAGQPIIVMLESNHHAALNPSELNKALIPALVPANAADAPAMLSKLSSPRPEGPNSTTSTVPVTHGPASNQLTPRLDTDTTSPSFGSPATTAGSACPSTVTVPTSVDESYKQLASFLHGEDKTASSFHAQMKLTPQGYRDLADFVATNTRVRSLSLSNALIGNDGIDILCRGLSQNKTISSIHLPGNKLTDEGVFSLVEAIRYNPSLTQLDLASNNIGDPGAVALAQLIEVNYKLTRIDLTHNQIGRIGCQALTAAVAGSSIKLLQVLPGNNIDKKDAKALVKAIQQAKSDTGGKEEFLHRLMKRLVP